MAPSPARAVAAAGAAVAAPAAAAAAADWRNCFVQLPGPRGPGLAQGELRQASARAPTPASGPAQADRAASAAGGRQILSMPACCLAGAARAALAARLRAARRARAGCRARRRAPALALAAEPEVDPRPQRESEPGAPPAPQLPPVRTPMISTGAGSIDVMSKLLQDRILFLGGQLNDEMANVLISQMLYLAKQDREKDITMYINSPGGSISAGLAIYDSMCFVPCDVSTVCVGSAASMGAFLLGAGTKGKRKCLPSSRVMIHQPLGGAGGQAADIEIQAREILFLREILNTYLADFTGKPIETIAEDCDRDYFMSAEEAVEYGLADMVVETRSWPRLQKPPRPSI